MAIDQLRRGIRFPFHSPATCAACHDGRHQDCDGTAPTPQSRGTTHCECQRVGHAPLIGLDAS